VVDVGHKLSDYEGEQQGSEHALEGQFLAQNSRAELDEETFKFLQLSARRDGAWTEPFGYEYEPVGTGTFQGRLIALTDERSFSTTDNFLRCMRDLHPRFTVVGRPSGAGTGAPATLATLKHSGARIKGCTMRVYGPLGALIEGRGTTPDTPVTWTRADVLAGRDPDLDAALRELDE